MAGNLVTLAMIYLGFSYFLFGAVYFALPGISTGTMWGRGKSYNFKTEFKMYLFCILFWILGAFLFGSFAIFMTITLLK